jgi:hypothetical protein
MYEAFRSGWRPTLPVSRGMWEAAKSLPDTDPMKAFCGFGCSFCGLYFQGYGKEVPGKYEHVYALRTLARDTAKPAQISLVDFLSVEPDDLGCILYLDPPYAGTAGYAGVSAFDRDRFVARVLEWSKHLDVFVSEYDFPIGDCVWSQPVAITVAGGGRKGKTATERLYYIPRGYEIERTKESV